MIKNLIMTVIMTFIIWCLYIFIRWTLIKSGVSGDIDAKAFYLVVFAALANILEKV
jgi:hypothetical protein